MNNVVYIAHHPGDSFTRSVTPRAINLFEKRLRKNKDTRLYQIESHESAKQFDETLSVTKYTFTLVS